MSNLYSKTLARLEEQYDESEEFDKRCTEDGCPYPGNNDGFCDIHSCYICHTPSPSGLVCDNCAKTHCVCCAKIKELESRYCRYCTCRECGALCCTIQDCNRRTMFGTSEVYYAILYKDVSKLFCKDHKRKCKCCDKRIAEDRILCNECPTVIQCTKCGKLHRQLGEFCKNCACACCGQGEKLESEYCGGCTCQICGILVCPQDDNSHINHDNQEAQCIVDGRYRVACCELHNKRCKNFRCGNYLPDKSMKYCGSCKPVLCKIYGCNNFTFKSSGLCSEYYYCLKCNAYFTKTQRCPCPLKCKDCANLAEIGKYCISCEYNNRSRNSQVLPYLPTQHYLPGIPRPKQYCEAVHWGPDREHKMRRLWQNCRSAKEHGYRCIVHEEFYKIEMEAIELRKFKLSPI